jgi:hypothetical protein
MEATAGAATGAAAAAPGNFGTGRVFVADSRLALGALNYGRRRALERYFGVSREQANLLTFVLALAAADMAYETTRRVVRAPLALTGADLTMGGFAMREAALGVAGPSLRATPLLGALVTVAVLGRLALPGVRRVTLGLRAAEQRVRAHRIGRYSDARRTGTPGGQEA